MNKEVFAKESVLAKRWYIVDKDGVMCDQLGGWVSAPVYCEQDEYPPYKPSLNTEWTIMAVIAVFGVVALLLMTFAPAIAEIICRMGGVWCY